MRKTIVSELNTALGDLLNACPEVLLLGEDIQDPYGGAFKVTKGLSTAHPGRVLNTPISEAGFVGVATGMAMRGLRPVVEIMFGDFLGLAMDQILNHACKFGEMYGKAVPVPLTIRTPMGGGRGYGPTHSQSLEKHFFGVSGLTVVALNPFHDVGALLNGVVAHEDGVVLLVEHKSLYPLSPFRVENGRYRHYSVRSTASRYPVFTVSPAGFDQPDVSVAVYGGMTVPAMRAATRLLLDHELVMELVVPTVPAHDGLNELLDSVERSGRLMTVEEGGETLGWGAEVLARVAASKIGQPRCARVAAADASIPCCREQEALVLPGEERIIAQALELCS